MAAERASEPVAPEARSGLAPWTLSELPAPPMPRGLAWIGVVGPGVIVLGASIGSGEFLLGPAVFVQHGLTLLWVSGVAIFLQTLFNQEVLRYTLATGEPVFTGFMRTRPSSTFWACFYVALYVLQFGWPAWAATAAGAIFFLGTGELAGAGDAGAVHAIGVGTFLACVALLLAGRRIERTLELLNWALVAVILVSFTMLALWFVPRAAWLAAGAGFAGFDPARCTFALMPAGVDFFLLGALVAYSGAGGVANLTLSNWARDKGYGMSRHAGYIPGAVGGERVNLAHGGFRFTPDAASLQRWHGWWRILNADQWGVFFTGALLGMVLPAMLYVTFIPAGSDIRSLGISAALAQAVGVRAGPLLALGVAGLGAWLLFKSQLDLLEGMTRAVTDMLWTGSRRVRALRGGDVRTVYYSVLAVIVGWGVFALGLAAPVVLLQIGANIAGVTFVIASLHLLYINTRLLPPELRPSRWRRGALIATAIYYCFFAALSLRSLL